MSAYQRRKDRRNVEKDVNAIILQEEVDQLVVVASPSKCPRPAPSGGSGGSSAHQASHHPFSENWEPLEEDERLQDGALTNSSFSTELDSDESTGNPENARSTSIGNRSSQSTSSVRLDVSPDNGTGVLEVIFEPPVYKIPASGDKNSEEYHTTISSRQEASSPSTENSPAARLSSHSSTSDVESLSSCDYCEEHRSDISDDDSETPCPTDETIEENFVFDDVFNCLQQPVPSVDEGGNQSLRSGLHQWALKYSPTHSSLDALLKLLIENGHPDLPKSSKTFMGTPRDTKTTVYEKCGGKYWYSGVQNGLVNYKTLSQVNNSQDDGVQIDVFVDGLSPYKSSKLHVWVIAGCLVGDNFPFLIGMWCGKPHEPTDVDDFFSDFVAEMVDLKTNGFHCSGKRLKVDVRRYIADASGRAWMRKTPLFNAYFGCERCDLKGEWLGRLTYSPLLRGVLRTDESFANRLHKNHHNGVSPLEALGTKMISQCPIDPMHCVFLGVTRRIISWLLAGKKSTCKLKKSVVADLSTYLVSLEKFFPSEFERRPRPLEEWAMYKGKEFRRLALYDFYILFLHVGDDKLRKLQCCFSSAIRILSDANLLEEFSHEAEMLLEHFARKACKLFGQAFNVFNVHCLIHLPADCSIHGTLDDFSAWKFENFLGGLKKLLKAPGKTIPQIVRRTAERVAAANASKEDPQSNFPILSHPHRNGPAMKDHDQFLSARLPNMILRVSVNDACVVTKAGEVVVIQNIVKDSNGEVFLLGNAFLDKTEFFHYGISSEALGILQVRNLGELGRWRISQIKQKVVLLPLVKPVPEEVTCTWMKNTECLCLPMLHFQY